MTLEIEETKNLVDTKVPGSIPSVSLIDMSEREDELLMTVTETADIIETETETEIARDTVTTVTVNLTMGTIPKSSQRKTYLQTLH
jgi:hypothetical protein